MATIAMAHPKAEQRTSALTKANDVRHGRRMLKAKIGALSQVEGRTMVAEIIRNPPAYVLSMEASSLILAIRTVGPQKAKRMMRRADYNQPFDPWSRLCDLSPRRREILAAAVESSP